MNSLRAAQPQRPAMVRPVNQPAPAGFGRTGMSGAPPAARPQPAVRNDRPPSAQPVARPAAEPARPAERPAEAVRPAERPAQPLRPAERPAEAVRPAERPAEARPAAEPRKEEPAARPENKGNEKNNKKVVKKNDKTEKER
jgi:hypothetical protein